MDNINYNIKYNELKGYNDYISFLNRMKMEKRTTKDRLIPAINTFSINMKKRLSRTLQCHWSVDTLAERLAMRLDKPAKCGRWY